MTQIVRFRNASEVTRLSPGEDPPAEGWAIGPDGVFRDGGLIGSTGRMQTASAGSDREDRDFVELEYVPLSAEK